MCVGGWLEDGEGCCAMQLFRHNMATTLMYFQQLWFLAHNQASQGPGMAPDQDPPLTKEPLENDWC